jgi:hypothetical protein
VGVSGRPAGRVCRAASARRRLTRVQQRRPQVTHSNTHTLTHTLSLTHPFSHSHTHSSTHTLKHPHTTHTLYRTLKSLLPYDANSFTDTVILSCCVTHSLTHSLTNMYFLPQSRYHFFFHPFITLPLIHHSLISWNHTFTHSITHSLIYHVLTHAMHSVSDLRIEPFDNQVQNSIDEFVAKWRKLDSEFLKKRKKREGNRGRTVGSLHLALPYGLDLWNIEGSFENTHHDRIPDEKKVYFVSNVVKDIFNTFSLL